MISCVPSDAVYSAEKHACDGLRSGVLTRHSIIALPSSYRGLQAQLRALGTELSEYWRQRSSNEDPPNEEVSDSGTCILHLLAFGS